MKLINQSFDILEQKDFSLIGIKKFIERCGRVCYKSENKITDTSYEKFVNMLITNHHDRPLEFGTIHLKMDFHSYDVMMDTLVNKGMLNQLWIKGVHKCNVVHVTTNYRYYLAIKEVYPDIEKFFTEEDNEYYPKRYTVHFILSRAIMDEFRTHVGLSHLAESSRFCNYSKDKFDNELTFIIPPYVNTKVGTDDNSIKWSDTVYSCEQSYLELLKKGWKPQEARDVLPLSVKSELISCGFEDAWENFLYRRCANDAHPMAREVAIPLKEAFEKLKE